ncbi:MAG: Response regulator of zinc sigma-54-dependent two-component system [Labilithrix sp.]|nr:Response regulator of zinc sigma-54-dependent two-component system [Labilithrix sp.]
MQPARALETTLGRVSLRMASSLDLDGVLGEVTNGLVRDLDAAMARVWLLRSADATPYLELVASAGLSERLDGTRSRVPVGSLKIGEIAATRTRVYAADLVSDPRFVDKAWIESNQLRAFAGYPLVFGDDLLGVVAMFSRRTLDEAEIETLGIFAAQASVAIKNAFLFAEVSDLSRRLEAENAYLREEQRDRTPSGIVGHSAAIVRVLREMERVAPTMSTVLLRGETGTGKELFARAIHEKSLRKRGPLVEVNCAAIAPSLLESELFGHERGAFTGAVQRRIGRFELAQGGTLFLDEIGELSLEAQAKLLRALQEHEIDRVGGTRTIRLDVRIVAATNRDLEALVRDSRFRADLFYRLAVFPIVVPPLRDRREDIPELVAVLLRALAARHVSHLEGVDADALAYLQAYDWPGNVRELQNVLERAAVLAHGTSIGVADLPELQSRLIDDAQAPSTPDAPAGAASLKERVDAYERGLVADALARANGNQSEAARQLGASRATLQYKLKLHRL